MERGRGKNEKRMWRGGTRVKFKNCNGDIVTKHAQLLSRGYERNRCSVFNGSGTYSMRQPVPPQLIHAIRTSIYSWAIDSQREIYEHVQNYYS